MEDANFTHASFGYNEVMLLQKDSSAVEITVHEAESITET